MVKLGNIVFTLSFVILQLTQEAVKGEAKHRRNDVLLEKSETRINKAKWLEKNWVKTIAGQFGIDEAFEEVRNRNVTKPEQDFQLKYNKNNKNMTILVRVSNFKFEKKKSGSGNKIEEGSENVNNWSFLQNPHETPTTDFSLDSSDFNAKESAGNTHKTPSQPNVPEKNKSTLNKVQLSFINNISNINTYAEDLTEHTHVKEDVLVKTAEGLAKEQKELLSTVTKFGLQRMNDLILKEKQIYDAGFYLPDRSPGSYLAAFNPQEKELKKLAGFGYAALEASKKLRAELVDSKLRQEILNVTEDGTKDFPEISLLDTSLHDNCPLKDKPRCPVWNHLFRTTDGTCNNLKNPWWGATFQPLKRFLAPDYSDGLELERTSVRGGPLPSPRLVSTTVFWEKDVNSKSVTHMTMLWGQFIDHDLTSSSQSRGFNGSVPKCCDVPLDFMHPDCLPIEVPQNDNFYGNFGIRCLEFLRSAPASRLGCGLGPREQISQVSAYIDGSMIYGNSEREASKLRLFRNGMLKYTRMPQRLPLLPSDRDKGGFCKNFNTDFFCFLSGDARMNEQPALIAIHVVFLRLHNRLTRELAHLNPEWSDERLYQETRKIVGAILQHITYREFLPIVLGQEVMRIFDIEPLKEGYYKDYSDKVSGTAANAFATAAFRFGHSMVQGKFMRWDDIRQEAIKNVSLHEELQDPGSLHRFGAVDGLMLGMCTQEAQKRDEHFTTELTNHLFQTPRFPAGLDLAAINIQRGRDHGLPDYNSWRNPCGLRKMKTWNDLLHVMSEETRDNLRKVYRDVDDIDLYVGGLAEFSVRGGLVGSTFSCIIAQHFRNIRKGDRFWYENGGFDSSFTLTQLKMIRRVTLARILCDNLDLIETIQPFAFLTVDNIRNPKVSCRSGEIPFIDLSPWEELPKGKWSHNFKSSVEYAEYKMPLLEGVQGLANEIPTPMDSQN